MLPNDFDTYRWRTSKLIDLVEQTGPDTRLRLVEWHILSDNETFFNFNETEFATCVHKLITPTQTFSCMESHGKLLTSVDIFQENVAAKDQPPEWVDKLPFYHSREKCSITDIQCLNLKSCNENTLNREVPEVKPVPVPLPPMHPMGAFMHTYSQPVLDRAQRSRLWSSEGSTAPIRPFGSYITPRLILGRNPAVSSTSFSYPSAFMQGLQLFDYPVAQNPTSYTPIAHTPMSRVVPSLQETLPDDDPAFDDMPELA